jgi:hypothetical protein
MKIKVSITVNEPKGSYETRDVATATLEVVHVADGFKARGIMAGVMDAIEDATGRVEAQLRAEQKSRDALAVEVEGQE